ncbi:MAG: helix-turn-helix transcriptional regulator [Lachnospiraceae bacterium]|jgi:AraC-like DNA-binding protein|nr:helix-turn-helix transcriptional regulator [Lachnospiraceae bacterium]
MIKLTHNLFSRYFFRYFRIILIPLAAGIAIYGALLHHSATLSDKQFLHASHSIAARVEHAFSDIKQVADILLSDASLVSLSRLTEIMPQNLDHCQKLSQIQKKLSLMQHTNGYIDSIQLLFQESQLYLTESVCYTINSSSSLPVLANRMGEEACQLFLEKTAGTSRLLFPSSFGETRLYNGFYYLQKRTTSTGHQVTLLFELNKSALRSQMSAENLSCLLYQENGFFSSELQPTSFSETLPLSLEQETGKTFSCSWQEDCYGILLSPDAQNLYSLLVFIPGAVYHSDWLYLNLAGVLYILFCLSVGTFASYLMAKKSVTPIANMLASLGAASGQDRYQDELKLIEDSLKELQHSNRQYRSNMNHYQSYLQNDCLVRLLKQRSYSNPMDLQQYQQFLATLQAERYLLLGFELEDASDLFFDSSGQEADMASQMQDMIFFVLQNVGNELLSEEFQTYFGDIDGHLVCLLGSFQPEADTLALLQKALSDLIYFCKQKFNVSIAVCISESVSENAQIPKTWLQVQEIIHYRNLVGSERYILRYSDLTPDDSSEEDTISTIVQALYRLDYQEALTRLSELCPAKKKPEERTVSAEVWDYIQSNYTDQNLSAGQIAEHFHMSPSGLSQIYKRDTGRGILDDIHYCRVQHAKELLAQNMTIQNAASLSGYYHTRPMVEAFKRIEGVTPSEYRRKHSG